MRTALALALAAAACGAATDAPSSDTQVAAPRLTVAFMGEDAGRVEPCGCAPAMLGGLARRSARITASRAEGVPFVVVAGGGAVERADDYDAAKFGVFADSYAEFGAAAFAPWPHETALLHARGGGGPPATTANAVSPPPWMQRFVDVAAAGATIRVAGLAAGDARHSDPAAAASHLRTETPGGVPLVLLTSLDAAAARAAARGLSGPTLVLFAAGNTDPRDGDAAGGSVAFAPYPAHGKYLGLAHLSGAAAAATWAVTYRPVVRELPEDAEVRALRTSLLASLRASASVARYANDARFVTSPVADGAAFAGTDACTACHAAAAEVHGRSRHASAVATLAATGDDADPGCVRCHVTGYGTGRGFPVATAPGIASVGCEACHGPRAAHVAERRAGRADQRPAALAASACASCHDAEHDPAFDFAAAWPRIAHGR